MSRPFILNDGEKECPCCNHGFMVMNPKTWVYKILVRGNWVYYCRYSCFRQHTLISEKTKAVNRQAYLRRINGRKQNGQPQNV